MKKIQEQISMDRERLTLKERIIASSGSLSACIDLLMIQTFLLYYYTDVIKINAVFAGGLLLISRIIAAIAVPIAGVFFDRSTTPWGKYKPYYLLLGIPTAFFGFLTFTNFNLGTEGKYIYAAITFFIYNLLVSIGGIPKGAMGPALTKSIEDRLSLGVLGFIFSVVGSIIAMSVGTLLIKVLGGSNEAKGYSLTMAIFASLCVLIAILQFVFLEEKYINTEKASTSHYPYKTLLSTIFRNKTAVIVLMITLSISLSNGIRMAVSIHFLKYYFHRPELMATVGLISMIGLIAGAFLSSKLTKTFGVKRILMISYLIIIVSFIAMYPVNTRISGLICYLLFTLINNFFNGLSSPAQSTLMPGVIDYCEWKTGISTGAFMNSLNSVVSTVGTAIAGVFVGAVLAFSGYQPNVEQTQTSLNGIKFLISIAPAITCILSLVVIRIDRTEKEHEKIAKELIERSKKVKGNEIS